MKRTLANLEREEAAALEAWKAGQTQGFSLREHLNNIRQYSLYEAVGAENFEAYTKLQRLPFATRHAYKLAACGAVESHLKNCPVGQFSDYALRELTTLRVEKTGKDGKVKKTHELNFGKIKKVADKAVKAANGQPITQKMVKAAIEQVDGGKLPKPFDEQCEDRIKSAARLLISLRQLEADVFLDAEQECPGVVTRLANKYSELASYLRKVLR